MACKRAEAKLLDKKAKGAEGAVAPKPKKKEAAKGMDKGKR